MNPNPSPEPRPFYVSPRRLHSAALSVLLSIIILFLAIWLPFGCHLVAICCPPHCNMGCDVFFCQFKVAFPLYVMGLMAFLGWCLLVFFAGVGFSAVPIDCIRYYYVNRSLECNAATSPTSPQPRFKVDTSRVYLESIPSIMNEMIHHHRPRWWMILT